MLTTSSPCSWFRVELTIGAYCCLMLEGGSAVMGIRTLTILFFFSFISDFTFLFLLLYFPGKMMKKAHDKEVT